MITKSVPARARSRTFAIGIEYITAHAHRGALGAARAAFEGGIDYATAPDKAAWCHARGVNSLGTAALEMEAVAALSSRCPDPVYHLIIAYAKLERPTREEVVSDAERLLKALGMEKHQYVLAAHQDTDDFHAHVIANRVGPNGRANDLWHERIIRERVCAEISAERGWDIVVGRHNRDIVQRVERLHDLPAEPARRLSDGTYRRLHERGDLPWQDVARPFILDAVERARDWADLHLRLAAHGVVVKRVRRGERVQGLAFAEGLDSATPGCAASRIDARCALVAMERRLGPFIPAHGVARGRADAGASRTAAVFKEVAKSEHWSDQVRPAVLAAVDAASSWADLRRRLAQHGIVIKVVERGGRVQGLAFAQGEHPDAPGCGASRIETRCKKSALEERLGPFQSGPESRDRSNRDATGPRSASGFPEASIDGATGSRGRVADCQRNAREQEGARHTAQAKRHTRSRLREQFDQTVRTDPEWALRQAGHIVDQVRLRSAYGEYRDKFFDQRRGAIAARRAAAWDRERAQRQLEADRRHDGRALLRAVVRLGSRGPIRYAGYWSIDAMMARRRATEFAASRARWRATKIVLATERGLAYEEKPMDYRSFVGEQARAGDPAAQRVRGALASQQPQPAQADAHVSPSLNRPARVEPTPGSPGMTTGDVRARLVTIRTAEQARYERARRERDALERIEPPPKSDLVFAMRRQQIHAKVSEATGFGDEKRKRLELLMREKKSWNPLMRTAATRAEGSLRANQQRRQDETMQRAKRGFEAHEVPQQTKCLAEMERQHREYVAKSLALERDMREARHIVRRLLPSAEERLEIIERAAVSRFDGVGPNAGLREIVAAVDRSYGALPESTRRAIEQGIRRDRKARDRSLHFIPMGDR